MNLQLFSSTAGTTAITGIAAIAAISRLLQETSFSYSNPNSLPILFLRYIQRYMEYYSKLILCPGKW